MQAKPVPDGWSWKKVVDLASVVGGSTPSRNGDGLFAGDIPWATPTDITANHGRFLSTTKEHVTEKGRAAAGLTVLPVGSILLTSRATIGAKAIASVPVTTNQGFQNLVPRDAVDSLWLYYAIGAKQSELEKLASGSTFREFSRDSLRNVLVATPEDPQERIGIAKVLDSIDVAIEKTEAVIEQTERLRATLLQELLMRGMPGRHSEWKHVAGIGTVPACWDVGELGDVVAIASGQVDPRDTQYAGYQFIAPDDLESGTRVLLRRRTVTDAGAISGKYLFDERDVVYSKIRPYLMKVYLPSAVGLCSADMYPIRPKGNMTREYLAWTLLSPAYTRYARTCSDRTGIPKINRADLVRYRLAIPADKQERDSIATTIEAVATALIHHRAQLEQLGVLKRVTADALLSGRVRVRQAEEMAV